MDRDKHIARACESVTLVKEMGDNLFDRAAGKFLYGALWNAANAVCDHDGHAEMSAATDKGSKMRKRFIKQTLSKCEKAGWLDSGQAASLYASAIALHDYFYGSELNTSDFKAHSQAVAALVDKMATHAESGQRL